MFLPGSQKRDSIHRIVACLFGILSFVFGPKQLVNIQKKGLNKHELKRFVYKNYCEEICGIWVRNLWVNS